jgi:hypothetical protein
VVGVGAVSGILILVGVIAGIKVTGFM